MTSCSHRYGSEKNLKDKNDFTDLAADDRRDIIDYVSEKTGLSRAVIEKDWWVTAVFTGCFLFAIFRQYFFQRRYESQ